MLATLPRHSYKVFAICLAMASGPWVGCTDLAEPTPQPTPADSLPALLVTQPGFWLGPILPPGRAFTLEFTGLDSGLVRPLQADSLRYEPRYNRLPRQDEGHYKICADNRCQVGRIVFAFR